MNDPQSISIKDYTYDLPISKIAQFPLEKRDNSKLLVSNNGIISDTVFGRIDAFIPDKSMVIFNDTKVVQARLLFKKSTGSSIELFCLEPYKFIGDTSLAFQQKGSCFWKCFVGNLKKWKTETLEKTIYINKTEIILYANKINQEADTIIVQFNWQPQHLTFAEILENVGLIPLPPYITRDLLENDKQRYQTIYANYDGSVAAPTAGLHFTDEVLNKLSKKSISKQYVTLHVGAGTFKPVSSQTMREHQMHAEKIFVNITLLENLLLNLTNNIICVGTTSVRTIESIYWFGVKLLTDKIDYLNMNIGQWEPYQTNVNKAFTAEESLKAIVDLMKRNKMQTLSGYTELIILPSYKFRFVNGIITNFHQPQSTLLLLIAAFLGDSWKSIYKYALDNNFRFLSYGDCCFFIQNKNQSL